MAFAQARTRQDDIAGINITPLVDVMLVLLVIFMISAPLMSDRTKIDLPRTAGDAFVPLASSPSPITIAITEEGRLFLNDEPMTPGLLESRLSVEAQRVPQPSVHIRGDKTTPYRHVREVVDVAQAQGLRKVGFMATPERD